MELPPHLLSSLTWFVEFLDQWLDRNSLVLGGGTVLAARWNHRYSTDIDLFMNQALYRDVINSGNWRNIGRQLNKLETQSVVKDVRVYPAGFSLVTRTGPVSLFGTSTLTQKAITSELECTTGIATESSAEILIKKIRARMINNTEYVARDLYDVVVAYMTDRRALNDALGNLHQTELDSLKYDVKSGDADVVNLDRILEPKYSELTDSLSLFNSVAGEVLSQNVSLSTARLLEEAYQRKNYVG